MDLWRLFRDALMKRQFPQGWYPSPTAPGRDQWWNGTEWTPLTQLADPYFDASVGIPPVESPGWGISAGTLPFLIVGLVLGLVSLTANPVFVLSFVGVIFSLVALWSVRSTPNLLTRAIMAVVAALGVIAGVIGTALEIIRLVG